MRVWVFSVVFLIPFLILALLSGFLLFTPQWIYAREKGHFFPAHETCQLRSSDDSQTSQGLDDFVVRLMSSSARLATVLSSDFHLCCCLCASVRETREGTTTLWTGHCLFSPGSHVRQVVGALAEPCTSAGVVIKMTLLQTNANARVDSTASVHQSCDSARHLHSL